MTEDDAHEAISRVGTAALMYYPEIHVDDTEYDLLKQAEWCLEPLGDSVARDGRVALRELVARTIVAPTAHREDLLAVLLDLVPAA